MKNSLFVGSFNPITNAHYNIANYLLNEKIVDYVYFLPVNSSKKNVSLQDRINMINLVINKNMKVLNILDYNTCGYFNYDTLIKIDNIKYIIMGADLFLKFNIFDSYLDILKKYYLIIIKRDKFDLLNYVKNNYQEYLDRIIVIDKEYPGSSTISRKTFLNLDKKVLDYIKLNNLYR